VILIQENLVSSSPLAAAYRRDLAISYNNLGMLQSRSGQLQRAISSFRRAEQLQRQLLADQATDVQLLSNQGSVLNNLGMALDRTGDAAAAESSLREAARFQKRALEESPNDAQVRTLLSRHYFNFARNLRRQEKFDEAVAAAIERGVLWQGQAEGLLSVAKELAQARRQMSEAPSATTATKDRCVRAAVDVLRQALAAGAPAERLHHSALASLASHEAYRALLNEFNHAGPSPPSTHQAQTPSRGESTKPLGEPGN
jgi:tetratricopeptide (TPR) repeat protein